MCLRNPQGAKKDTFSCSQQVPKSLHFNHLFSSDPCPIAYNVHRNDFNPAYRLQNQTCIHSLTHSLIRSHSLTNSLTHSLTHLLSHSLTHSLNPQTDSHGRTGWRHNRVRRRGPVRTFENHFSHGIAWRKSPYSAQWKPQVGISCT